MALTILPNLHHGLRLYPGSQREYIQWRLESCSEDNQTATEIFSEEATDLLSERLRTPLQIQQHLALALEAGYDSGDAVISAGLAESVLSHHIDDLESTLVRHGYRVGDLAVQFDARPAEIKALFSNN